MSSKYIVLAKMSRRIFAAIIDLLIMLIFSFIIFFPCGVYNAVLDQDSYDKNLSQLRDIYASTGLYIEFGDAMVNIASIQDFEASKPDELNHFTYEYEDEKYEIYLVDAITNFYLSKGNESGILSETYSLDVIKRDLFLIRDSEENSTSNIKDLYLDEADNKYKISFFDSKDANAIKLTSDTLNNILVEINNSISSNKNISNLLHQNDMIMVYSVLYLIPVTFGVSIILYLIIPLLAPTGETIGKFIFGLGVLSEDGYSLKRIYLIPRFLGFYLVDFLLGIVSFGVVFVISYMMFCFTKKRRAVEDYFGKSVVIDKKQSSWFKNKEEEEQIKMYDGDVLLWKTH